MRLAILGLAAMLAGCAYNVTLMPRDSGKTYTGSMEGSGGRGTMTLAMGEVSCTGPVAKVGSNEAVTVGAAFVGNNRGGTATGLATSVTDGDIHLKAMLTCSDGSGLRCDLTGRGASGGGVCMDDKGRTFDALATRR